MRAARCINAILAAFLRLGRGRQHPRTPWRRPADDPALPRLPGSTALCEAHDRPQSLRLAALFRLGRGGVARSTVIPPLVCPRREARSACRGAARRRRGRHPARRVGPRAEATDEATKARDGRRAGVALRQRLAGQRSVFALPRRSRFGPQSGHGLGQGGQAAHRADFGAKRRRLSTGGGGISVRRSFRPMPTRPTPCSATPVVAGLAHAMYGVRSTAGAPRPPIRTHFATPSPLIFWMAVPIFVLCRNSSDTPTSAQHRSIPTSAKSGCNVFIANPSEGVGVPTHARERATSHRSARRPRRRT